MAPVSDHIFPISDRLKQRDAREKLLNQHGIVLWMTGLSGSGKSTIAQHLEAKLYDAGFKTMVLDGDNVRAGLNADLTFAAEDRKENIRRIAEVAKLFANNGLVTLCSFISPTLAMREQAAGIIGDDFNEIYVAASLEVCEDRDVKGLYKKARSGEIPTFTGVSAPYEEPQNPALRVESGKQSLDECVDALYNFILPRITYTDA